MADVPVDTGIFVDYLRGAAAIKAGKHRFHYSVITRAALFAGNTATQLRPVPRDPSRPVHR